MGNHEKSQTLTVTIIALNEEADLPRCLESVRFANEVILIDTGSSDKTVKIAQEYGAKVFVENWLGYGAQKNSAHAKATSDWVLNIDADEEITNELKSEIQSILLRAAKQDPMIAEGYLVARKTFYLGKWIRYGGWYPNFVARLCRKQSGTWTEPQVHEELKITGSLQKLKHSLNHYTFSGIEDQIRTNLRYAKQGAVELQKSEKRFSFLKLFFKPVGKFIETYFFKLGFLDGWRGFLISINAAHSMFLKFALLWELEQNASSHSR